MWIDAHCHLAAPRLLADADGVVERARAAGVGALVQGGVSPPDWEAQRRLAERFGARTIATAFGLHPWWVERADDAEVERALEELERAAAEAVLIGEAGLDAALRAGARGKERLARQGRVFARQIAIAQAARKPLVLHVVRAHGEAARILAAAGPLPAGGIVHAFTGPREAALSYVRLGLLVSISGAVARQGYRLLKEAVGAIPRDHLLIETDAPDGRLPGGSPSEPADLPRVAAALAEVLGDTAAQDLLDASAARLKTLLSW